MDYSNTHSASHTPARTGSPDIDTISAGDNSVGHGSVGAMSALRNPFMSPFSSRPESFMRSTSSAVNLNQAALSQRYFHSRRIKKGEIERPWLAKKDPREKWVWILPLIGLILGLGLAGFLVWDGLRSVVNHEYCQILDENWSGGFNEDVWTKEVEVGGFGYVWPSFSAVTPLMPDQQRTIRTDHRHG